MATPLDSHWTMVKRILRYLKSILFHGLLLQPTSVTKPLVIRAFCDVDWASDVDDRRSTLGTAIFLGPNQCCQMAAMTAQWRKSVAVF